MDPIDIKLNVSGKLPGEELLVAIFNFISKNRETMSQENRDRWDALQYSQAKAWNNVWVRNFGWPGDVI